MELASSIQVSGLMCAPPIPSHYSVLSWKQKMSRYSRQNWVSFAFCLKNLYLYLEADFCVYFIERFCRCGTCTLHAISKHREESVFICKYCGALILDGGEVAYK